MKCAELRIRPGRDGAAVEAAAADLTSTEKSPAVAEVTGIVAPPAGPDGRADHIHGLGLGLNKNAKNKEGAVKFLKWLATEDAALLYARSGGSPALSTDVVAKVAKERPDLVKLGDSPASTAMS